MEHRGISSHCRQCVASLSGRIFLLLLLFFTAIGFMGCLGGDEDRSRDETDGDENDDVSKEQMLSVQLSTLPADAGATAWLLIMEGAELVESSVSGDAVLFNILSVSPENPPFNVTVHIPDSAGWEPSDAFGSGYYAIDVVASDVEAAYRVSYWTHSDRLVSVTTGGLKTAGEEDSTGSIAGTVTDQNGTALEYAMVEVPDQVSDMTAADGSYMLEKVRSGNVTLWVSGAGIEQFETQVTVTQGATATVNPSVTYNPDSISMVQGIGKVTDEISGEGVEGVQVNLSSVKASVSVTTDSKGEYTGQFPSSSGRWILTREDYARRSWSCFFLTGDFTWDFLLLPLPQEIYGTWQYCYSQAWEDDYSEYRTFNMNDVDTGVDTGAMQDLTFRSDGTAEFEGFKGYWAGNPDPDETNKWWLCGLNFQECISGCNMGPICMPKYYIEGEYLVQDYSWCDLFDQKHRYKQGSIDDCPRGGIDGDEDGDEDFDEGGGEACEDMIDYYEDQIEAAFGMLPGCEHCMDDFLECAWTGCDPNDPNGTVSPCWTAATQCITQDCVMDY